MDEAISYFLTFISGIFVSSFLSKYFSEKGKNLASKEDVTEITDKIESVKNAYSKDLEELKTQLSSKLHSNSFRYEKEYEILSELSKLVVNLRDASLSLRPVLDYVDPGKTPEEIRQERLGKLAKAGRNLYKYKEIKSPFYSKEVYRSLKSFDDETHREFVQYKIKSIPGSEIDEKYWNEATENQSNISAKANALLEVIRARVTEWENVYFSN